MIGSTAVLVIVAKLIEIYQRQQNDKTISTTKDHTQEPEFARVTPYNKRVLRGDIPVFEKAVEGGDLKETVFEALEGMSSCKAFGSEKQLCLPITR